jgi:hypothetical protein
MNLLLYALKADRFRMARRLLFVRQKAQYKAGAAVGAGDELILVYLVSLDG